VIPRTQLPSRRLRTPALATALLAAALACTAPSPAPEPTDTPADFDAPRPAQVRSFLQVSVHRERRGDLEGALRAAEQARAAGPSSTSAALREAELQAVVARRAGDEAGLADARARLEALRAQYPGAPATRLAAIRLALADGRLEEAAAAARALVEERPEDGPPRVLLAGALLAKDPREALVHAERAVTLDPSDPDALAVRAAAHLAHAQDRAAETDARRALRLRPDPRVAETLARAQLRSGRARAAIRSAEAVLEAERTSTLELVQVRAHWELGEKDAALAALGRAKQRAGDDADRLADVLDVELALATAEGHPATARASIETARSERPDDARLAELAAVAALAEGDLPAAEASARRAAVLAPQRPSAWQTLAFALERRGARPPARERARIALDAAPDDPRADLLAGLLAELAGQIAPAREAYEAALAGDAGLAVARLRLAKLLALEARDPERAAELAEAALPEVGWSFASAEVLGGALRAAGRAADAVVAYRVALGALPQLGPESEDTQLSLAMALAADGRQNEAKSLLSALVGAAKGRDPAPAWLSEATKLRDQLSTRAEPPAAAAR